MRAITVSGRDRGKKIQAPYFRVLLKTGSGAAGLAKP
jgi:hypothetical protein